MSEPERIVPMMRLNVPPEEYLEEFYNKCHDKNGLFCEDQPGKGKGLTGNIRRPSNKGVIPDVGNINDLQGLDWSKGKGQDLRPDERFNQKGTKTPRWVPENKRQAAALDRLKSVPSAGDQGKNNRDWIRTNGQVNTAGKDLYDENKAKAVIDGTPGGYPVTKVETSSIIPSEYYVKRNSVAETIHQTDKPNGPYARPGYLPILVPSDSGGYLLVNGNHRVEAAHYLQEKYLNANVMNPDEIRN